MKKTALSLLILIALAGCQQKNLTWTPTEAEWSQMTLEQQNNWYRAEIEARGLEIERWRQRALAAESQLEGRAYGYELPAQKQDYQKSLDRIERQLEAIDTRQRYGY